MRRISDFPACIFRRCKGSPLSGGVNKRILQGCSLLLFIFLFSCASTGSATYESQRRGLLMLEGEHIYKNKGFYKSKQSIKRRKKAMRTHRKSLRR